MKRRRLETGINGAWLVAMEGTAPMLRTDDWVFLQELRPFLVGFTLFFWSAATWLATFANMMWSFSARFRSPAKT